MNANQTEVKKSVPYDTSSKLTKYITVATSTLYCLFIKEILMFVGNGREIYVAPKIES